MTARFSAAASRCGWLATSLLAALTAGCEKKLTEAEKKARDERLMEYLGPRPGAVHTFLAGPNDQSDVEVMDIGAESGDPAHLIVNGQTAERDADGEPPFKRFELLVRDGRLLRREPLEDRVLLEEPIQVGAKPWYYYLPEFRKKYGKPLSDIACRITAVQRKEIADVYTDTVEVTCDRPVPEDDIVLRDVYTLAKGLGIIEERQGMAHTKATSFEPDREGPHRRLIGVEAP